MKGKREKRFLSLILALTFVLSNFMMFANVKKAIAVEVTLIDEGFDSGKTAPQGWTFNNIEGTYTTSGNYGLASPSLKLDSSADGIVTPLFKNPKVLSFWIKGQGTDANSSLLVEQFDGTNWAILDNIKPLPTSGVIKTYPLNSNIVQVKFSYTKVAGNLSFDDVKITGTVDEGETVRVTGITIDKQTAEVEVGNAITLEAWVQPQDATNKNIIWSSSDETVAQVNGGVVKGIKEGKAIIAAITEDGGYRDTCEVTVKPASILSIAEARQKPENTIVAVRGIVTWVDGSNYYIQDDAAGINVYKYGLDLKVGDQIVVKGPLAIYNGLLEIKPASNSDVTAESSNNALPQPKVVKISQIGEAYEGQLVKIKGAILGAINTTGNTTLTDDTGTINIYKIPSLMDIKEGDKVDVTAIVSQYKDYQLRVRNTSDIVLHQGVFADDLFISEYIEGSSNNKAIEIFNGTGKDVDLSKYTLKLYSNGSTTPGNTLNLAGTLANGDVYVIANSSAADAIKSRADIISGVANFNGDDALTLEHDGVVIDSFGQVGFDPGTSWGSGATVDHTLIRKSTVTKGDSNSSDAFDPSKEWDIKNINYFDDLGIHTMDGFEGGTVGEDTTPPAITHDPVTKGSTSANLDITAKVTDNKRVAAVKLYYRAIGQTTYKSMEMELLNGNYSASIPREDLSTTGLEYYIEATDGTNTVTSPEDKNSPYKVNITDSDLLGPEISDMTPGSGEFTGENLRPVISAKYKDTGSGIDTGSARLYLDNTDVTDKAVITEDGISYTPEQDLSKGIHYVKLELRDKAPVPNTGIMEWNFYVGKEEYNIYFGQLHSHTNYSDGQGTPEEAYDWAKNTAKADFFAVTDHSNSLDNDTSATLADGSASNEWKKLHEIADKYNEDGKFAAIAGFEMTWSGSTGGWGHINTFNTPGFLSRNSKIDGKSVDLPMYYNEIKKYPMSISQFNHPGTTFGDFGDFGYYDPQVDSVVNLIEVGNGEGPVRGSGYFPSYEYYTRALDKGWHVAPTNNQDNHKANWVTANTARTVVLAPALSREYVYDALRKMRVYATEDENLRIMFKANDKVMGSFLSNPSSLDINISIQDPDISDKIGKVSIITNGGVVAASKNFDSNTADWSLTLSPQYSYYYVRVDQEDKDIAVTAPVWTGANISAGISKVEASQNIYITNNPVDLKATLFNNGDEALKDVKVEFFVNEIKPENKIEEKTISEIPIRGTADTLINWTPDKAGSYIIYAATTLNINGEDRAFTASTKVEVANKDDIVKVVVDEEHYNQYVSGDYSNKITALKGILSDRKFLFYENKDALTQEDLRDARILIITDPQSKDDSRYNLFRSNFTDAEIDVIKNFVTNGGSLIITSRADYNDKGVTEKAYENSNQGNRILEAIGSNLRFNDDEVIDKTSNGGQEYRLYFDDYVSTKYGLTNNIPEGLTYSAYSGCSVILKDGGSDSAVDWLIKGHETTETLDSDLQNDAAPVEKGNVYSLAAEVLPGGGKLIVAGTTFFSDFETTGDNEYANRQITQNILGWMTRPKLSTIAQVREDKDRDGILDNLGKKFMVEGRVTAASKAAVKNTAFFDVFYVQDETGGITVFGVSNKSLPLGSKVRVIGKVDQYDGDAELQLSNENYDIEILGSNIELVEPRVMKTYESMLEENEGWLVKVEGKVTKMTENSLFLDDGSGEARIYVNGYIGDDTDNPDMLGKWDRRIKVGDVVSAVGLASEDPEGHRIRVRNTSEIVLVNSAVLVTGISLDKTNAELKVGDTLNLKASITPDNATNKNVSWESDNEAVARVDNNGKVTALKEGKATITVTTEDGSYSAECKIVVKANETTTPGNIEQPGNSGGIDTPISSDGSKVIPKTGSPVDRNLLITLGILALGAGVFMVVRKRKAE